MATNENNNEPQNAIDALNENLTRAGERVANNKKIIYWCIALIAIFAAGGAAWYWGYFQPSYKNSQKAYFEAESKALGNDSIAAAEFAKVADKFGSSDAGKPSTPLCASQPATTRSHPSCSGRKPISTTLRRNIRTPSAATDRSRRDIPLSDSVTEFPSTHISHAKRPGSQNKPTRFSTILPPEAPPECGQQLLVHSQIILP